MCKRPQLYPNVDANADAIADANVEMSMPRFPNDRFLGFCQFYMEKKEFADEDIVWFSIRPFDVISNYNETNLLDMYMLKVDNKNTRLRHETCLKLKLKSKYTRKTLSNGALLSIVKFEHISYLVLVFLLWTLNI